MKKSLLSLLLCALSCAAFTALAQQPLYLQDNYYHKRMVKVFKSLQEHKLDKAAKYMEDIRNKSVKDTDIDPNIDITSQLFPLWQLSECMMMNIRDGRGKSVQCLPYDPWNAYRQLKGTYRDTYDIASADLFFADERGLKMSVADIKRDIEANLVDTVRMIATEAAYDELIGLLFDCSQMNALKSEREQVAYDGVKHVDDLERSQQYLDKYKDYNTSHHAVIEWRRDSLAYELVDSTATSCQRYLDLYPSSRFCTAVEQQLHHCAFNEMTPTVESCKQYLKKYPESRFADRVRKMEVDYAYRDARQKNTVGAYHDFITGYPAADVAEEAAGLMQQVFDQRYFNSHVSLAQLMVYCNSVNGIEQLRDGAVKSLFENLLLMPTSTLMMGCDGLLGEVTVTTTSTGTENLEQLVFNQQGLLIRHANRATGQSEDYVYDFDPIFGFKMLSKTDAKGRTVTYATRWNYDGSLSEIIGSDGSRMVYHDSDEYMKKIMHYKGKSLVKTDYFDGNYRLVKSLLPGNQEVGYGYNPQGDVSSMTKMQGTDVKEQNSYEYEYEENPETGRHWITRTQYNGSNKIVQTKVRHFYQTIYRIQSDGRQQYKIDWNFESEPEVVKGEDITRN